MTARFYHDTIDPRRDPRAGGLSQRQIVQRLVAELEQERASFVPHWRELSDYIFPRRARFSTADANRGDKRSRMIIDSTGTRAARVLQSGMMSGITSPARPWFRLTTPDPDLAEFGPVKDWLHVVGQRLNTVFIKSNLYNVLPIVYGDMGVFATAAMSVLEDDETVIRCFPYPVGAYAIANDSKLRVRVFCREVTMTVRQLVEQFARRRGRSGSIDWSNFSTTVQTLWHRHQLETKIPIRHVIRPNDAADPTKLASAFKPFTSCYYEPGASEDVFLSEAGFDEFPVLAPRWEVTGEDAYGTSCPGMIALGDIKQLQLGEKMGMQAIEKIAKPPMIAPTSLQHRYKTILPGDVTYEDTREGQKGFRPAFEVRPQIQELEGKQEQVRGRIHDTFFVNLFLMLSQSDRREITAREVDERHEEKLLALGPVLEQLNQDLLDPLINRAFAAAHRRGLIPDAPDELQGSDLRVEYISVMAQAQKMVGLAGLERFAAGALQFAQLDPTTLDKWDRDQWIDEYGEMMGVPPRLIVPDEQVAAIRQARAQQQQQQQQLAMMEQMAGSAKTLAETDTTKPSALRDVLGSLSQAGEAGAMGAMGAGGPMAGAA